MTYFYQRREVRQTVEAPKLDTIYHAESDSGNDVHYNLESVWCTICAKPRFGDDVYTDICLCYSPVNSIDSWLDMSAFDNEYRSLWPAENEANMSSQSASLSPVQKNSSGSEMSYSSSPAPSSSTSSSRNESPSYDHNSIKMDHCEDPRHCRLLNSKLRRQEQNRKSQRSFRERKDKIAKDLQAQVDELTKANLKLSEEIAALRKEIRKD